jgi:hypothetical protein
VVASRSSTHVDRVRLGSYVRVQMLAQSDQ